MSSGKIKPKLDFSFDEKQDELLQQYTEQNELAHDLPAEEEKEAILQSGSREREAAHEANKADTGALPAGLGQEKGLEGTSLLEDDENTNRSFDEVAPGEHPSRLRQLDEEGPSQPGDRRERQGSGSKI